MKKVFLGGTCNESKWREEIIPYLKDAGLDYFNPVVDDWTPECQEQEIEERENADFVLYVITPKMTGVYSIAELVDDSNKRPEKTVYLILPEDGSHAFTRGQWTSLMSVSNMVAKNGANYFNSLYGAAKWMGEQK